MTTVTTVPPRTRRGTELVLTCFAVLIVLAAYVVVDLNEVGHVPPALLTEGSGLLVIAIVMHLLVRWRASYADPLLLPIATLLTGLGLVMIHRIDVSPVGRTPQAPKQVMWFGLAVLAAALVLIFLKQHRYLRRFTYLSAATAIVLLILPLLPFIGRSIGGSRIWVRLGPFSIQPVEFAKILLVVFFAGYLVQTRDALSLIGRRILGFPLPRMRDMGPMVVAWIVAVVILVIFENDLGQALLLFGLFVVLLYAATERSSWVTIGLLMFALGVFGAYYTVPHFAKRLDLMLDPFGYVGPLGPEPSNQVAMGLMGLAAGGILGTGLGRGHPYLTPNSRDDYIFASLGEELGLIGVFVVVLLFLIFVERGLRAAIGVRDGFGKLLATGLSATMALQFFVIVGGVTGILPLTGLTTPFMSQGGSSLISNWVIVAILLKISDQARRPVDEKPPTTDEMEAVSVR